MMVHLEKVGGVAEIILDRPPANTYDYDFLRDLGSVIDTVRQNDDIRAVVVTSASERFFSAGADISAFERASNRQRSMTALLAHEVFRKLECTPLVFIAAIGGFALGGGFELALACDLRFAADGNYTLGLPEVGLGLLPGSGGTQRLPRIIGLSRGLDAIVKGKTYSPPEAKDCGLVDELFRDHDACRVAAFGYAQSLAEGPTDAIGHAKVAISAGISTSLDSGLAIEREAISHIFATADAAEGIRAFAEKRKPVFQR